MAAFAAQNDLEGLAPILPPDTDLSGYQVVDLRDDEERSELPLAGVTHAKTIPLNSLRARLGELDKSRPTVVSCHSGLRAHVATRLLREHGFNASNLSGAALIRDLTMNRPDSLKPETSSAACSSVKPCGAQGTMATDKHDELHPLNLLAEAQGGGCLLDVRSPGEFRSGRVQGAVNLPLEQVTVESVRQLLAAQGKTTVLLLCASGGRARSAASKLANAGLRTLVVVGGTQACRSLGLPIESESRGMISIERQVRIGAGLMVATGVALGTFVHPGFYGLSAFVGCGLIFAGVTDWCGMGLLLARMPWNK